MTYYLTNTALYAEINEPLGSIPNLEVRLLDGSTTTLEELYSSGPLLIDLWATWCVPCKKLMRYLNEYHQKYSNRGFKVLMINTDTPRSIGKVKSYIRSQGFQFSVALDPNKVLSKKLNGIVMPTTILVSDKGKIIWRHQGFNLGEETLIQSKIESILMKKNVMEKMQADET